MEFSNCGKYRYRLHRTWDRTKPWVIFALLNPSTADAIADDPTVRRCIGFAKRWGCGSLAVLNVFALRSTDPKALKKADDPVGPKNAEAWSRCLKWVMRTNKEIDADWRNFVVCGWGTHAGLNRQDRKAMQWIGDADHWINKAYCLGETQDGFPRHPLYLPYYEKPVPYFGRAIQ